MTSRALSCAWLTLFAATARAQTTTFGDGFEGTLLRSDVPAGVWSYRVDGEPLNFFGTSRAAAKVGVQGLRNLDMTAGAAYSTANGLTHEADLDAGSFDQYVRVWFRGSNHNLIAQAKIIAIDLAPLALPAAEIYYSDKSIALRFFDRTGTQFNPFVELLQTDGQWVLLEVFITNLGTAQGTLALSIDGKPKYATRNIDWSGQLTNGIQLGNLYGLGDFQATLDFDNVRAGISPQAAVMAISGSVEIAADACVPYSITLRNSFDGGAARAPAATLISLDAGGTVLFSTSGSCTPSVTSVRIEAGAGQADFFVRASSGGAITLTANNEDFPDGTLTVLVDGGLAGVELDAGGPDAGGPDAGGPDAGDPDAGQPRGPAILTVGCGCQSGSAGMVFLMLALLLRRGGSSREARCVPVRVG